MSPVVKAHLSLTPLEDRTVPTAVTAVIDVTSFGDVTEGGTGGLVFTRTVNTTGALTVNYSIGGTATNGSDHSLGTSGTVEFADGVGVATVLFTPTNDTDSEPTETMVFTLTSGTGYTIGTADVATVNLFDNDAQVVTVEKVADTTEGGSDGTFRFIRTGDLSGSLVVNYSSAGGTAISGTDFTALSGTFAASAATANVAVAAIHDSVEDEDETVIATVTSGTGYTVGGPYVATVTIIDVPDLLPTAYDGWATVSVNDPVIVDVLELSSDMDDDALTVLSVTQGDHGSVVDNLDGTVTYTPDTDFAGEDWFTYTVEDAFGNESTGTVYVRVTAPVASPTSVWTDEDTPITVAVLDMAFDPDEDELTTTAVTQGTYGTVVLNVDGTVTYTPNTSYVGEDSFTYTVEDPDGNEATNTITVTVGDTDPIVLYDTATTDVNTALEITAADYAFDPFGDTLTVSAVTQGGHGTVVNNFDGTITYTPDTDYEGTDTFTYTVLDANSNPTVGTITVTVGPGPSSTPASEIEDALSEIVDEIEDEGSPATIQTAAASVIDALTDYMGDATSAISAANIETLSANNSDPRAFVKSVANEYLNMYDQYNQLRALEAQLAAILIANKARVEAIVGELTAAVRAPNPNSVQILALRVAFFTLHDIHDSIHLTYQSVAKATFDSYARVLPLRTALGGAFPGAGPPAIRRLPTPTLPTPRNFETDFTPKLN